MRVKSKRIAIIITAILTLASSAFAVPQLINYQGALSDSSGSVNSDVSITFTIYNAPTAGDVLWTETQTVSVTDGVFNVLLGSQTPFPADLFSGDERYLGVQVGTDPEMAPRQRLASVPFAMRALSVACTPGDFEYCYSSSLANTINIGKCRIGTRTCGPDGTFGACVGEVLPAEELCDTLDNDCDSTTPDGSGEPTYGYLCDGDDSDLCDEGVIDCSGGALACSDNTGDTLDLCNGDTNDDCNAGTPDGADEPTIGYPCDGDDSDLCKEGAVYCSGVGGLACSDSTGDTVEICGDGIDNDCDDETDEDCFIHYIFVSYPYYAGTDLGSGWADTFCQTEANSGTFTSGLGATWKALISYSNLDAKDVVTVLGKIYNTNNGLIANNAADLWDGSIVNPALYNASGVDANGYVWTGSDSSGAYGPYNCNDWQAFSGYGEYGWSVRTDASWLEDNWMDCNLNASIYCISSAIPQ